MNTSSIDSRARVDTLNLATSRIFINITNMVSNINN